jgi:hypothetical protein
MTDADTLTVWTIFREPRDSPPGYRFVVRGFDVGPNGESVPHPTAVAAMTLAGARAVVPPGLVRWPRDPGDDPVIVESWI